MWWIVKELKTGCQTQRRNFERRFERHFVATLIEVSIYFGDFAAEEDLKCAESSESGCMTVDPFVDVVSFPTAEGILFYFSIPAEILIDNSLLSLQNVCSLTPILISCLI